MNWLKIIVIVTAMIAIIVVLSLIWQSDTYSNFDLAKIQPDKTHQIIGRLDKNYKIQYVNTNDSLWLIFKMIDQHNNSEIIYHHGVKPNDFEKSEDLVVIGKYKDNRFLANELLVKCPSKYSKQDEPIVSKAINDN